MAELDPLTERPADADVTPVTTSPVTFPGGGPGVEPAGAGGSPPGGARRPGVLRWAVALVVLALVVGTVSVAAAFLAAGGSSSVVEGWIPKGTLAYAELRADLPGNQKAQLATLLKKFPGFRDQAQTDIIVDQALTDLLDRAHVSWSSDVKPWLGGEVGVAVTGGLFDNLGKAMSANVTSILANVGSDAPGIDPSTLPAASAPFVADDGLVVLVSVKDGAAAGTWLAAEIARAGQGAPTTTTYAGGDLATVKLPGASVSWAVRGQVLVFGLDGSVKAALDTAGKGDVVASADFKAAKKAAPDAYLAFGYIDLKAYMAAVLNMDAAMGSTLGSQATGMASSACIAKMTAAMPGWAGGSMEAVDGALRFDMAEQVPAGQVTTTAANGASTSAAHLPATTVAAFEARGLGPLVLSGWKQAEDMLACDPATKTTLDQVDSALGRVGGLETLVGWAGDTSIAITRDGTTWGGGLVAVASDPKGAAAFMTEIKGLATLAAPSAGATYSEEAVGSATVSLLRFPGMSTAIAATLKDDVFYLGTDDFVRAALAASSGSSLADQAGYKDAIARAGGAGVEDMYVNITAIREGVEALAPASSLGSYTTGIQPYLVPFDSLAAVTLAPVDSTVTSHLVVVLK